MNLTMNINRLKFQNEFYSFIVAYVIMIQMLIVTFEVGYNLIILSNLCIINVFGMLIIYLFMNKLKMKRDVIIMIMSFICLFLISYVVGTSGYSIIQFSVYVIIPFLMAYEDISTEKLLKYIMYISLISFPVLNKILIFEYTSLQQIDMASAYALLTGVIATMLHFIFYRKKKNILIICSYAYNFFVMLKILMVGNRGIFLVLIVLILLIQIFYLNNKEMTKNQHIKWGGLMILEILFGLIILLYFNVIILTLYEVISHISDAVPSFIIKMKRQIIGNDIGNGRNEVYSFFIKKIISNPIGFGIESSLRISNQLYAYPHNFLMQLILELGWIGGYLLSCITLAPLFFFFKTKNDRYNRNYIILLLFIIVITIPKCMISGDIWMQPQFWYMVGIGAQLVIKRKFYKKRV